MMKVRINADDFGISPGVNSAILKMFNARKLNSASLILGCGFSHEAMQIAKKNPDLKVGLHFNLSIGKSSFRHAEPSLLVDEQGNFKNGFSKLLLLSFLKKRKLLSEIKNELEAQIAAIESEGITISHIDGHRHVHVIPGIFGLVTDVAKKRKIEYVRVINESLFATFSIKYPKTFLWNGGIVKWTLLRFLCWINGSREFSTSYFFSILYSCEISSELFSKMKVPASFHEVEVMIHPGDPTIDLSIADLQEKNHLNSNKRNIENLL